MGEHGALIDANAVIDRMRVVTDTSTDIALCAKLQLGTSAVSTWRRRQSVPYAECVNLALRYGVSLDWLLLGLGTRDASSIMQNAVTEPGVLPYADPRVARIVGFVRAWQASHDSDDVAWLERTLARAVPEYAEWLAAQTQSDDKGRST